MRLRSRILAASLACAAFVPLPALAQVQSRTSEMAEKLNDPATQYAVAGMLSAMSKAVLEMRIEPLVKTMEEMGMSAGDLPPDATLGDVAKTDSDEIRGELIDKVPRAMSAMGTLALSFEEMMPEIRKMADKMRGAIPRY